MQNFEHTENLKNIFLKKMNFFYPLALSLLFCFSLIILPLFAEKTETDPWMVYYNNVDPVETFFPYNPIVFDSDAHPVLLPLIENQKEILGYISLGEVENNRDYFSQVQQEGLLLEENPFWPGSFFVDIRNPLWAKRVIEELIPNILYQRFNGIFLDTLDDAEYLEPHYPGMIQAAVHLVKAIRYHYPTIKIMLNRAYYMYPEVAQDINMVLGESLYTDYDFQSKKYKKVDLVEYQKQVKLLQEVKSLNPDLLVYTLDYWNPEDEETIKQIYQEERDNGFIPYVSTVDLQKVIKEPGNNLP